MKYRLHHRTRYSYDEPVDLAYHLLHLRLRECPAQRVLASTIACNPTGSRRSDFTDHFGNAVTHLTIDTPHAAFTVDAQASVDVAFPPPPPAAATPAWEVVRDGLAGDGFPLWVEASEFAHGSPMAGIAPELSEFARPSFPPGRPILDAALDLTSRIHAGFVYDSTATVISTPLIEVLANRRGVCQDFAHLQVAALRSLGLAARYVSGYLRTYPKPGEAVLRGADQSHAWVSVWLGDHGWVDLDPTNDLVVAEDHVVAGWGRDFRDVSPVCGIILGGGAHTLQVEVTLTPEP